MALRALQGIRQLRFILCQSSSHSEPLRKYIAGNYDAIRQSKARIIIRECENMSPIAIATYNYGIERTLDLKRLNINQIQQAIANLQAQSKSVSGTITM